MSEMERTPKDEQIDEDGKRFNQQINFYIMRYMWQVIRKRSSGGTIYLELETSRGRYTRIVDGENVHINKEELERWPRMTGLPKEVFTGDIRIECAQYERPGGPKTVTTEEWKELFDLRKKRYKAHINEAETSKTEVEEFEASKEAHSKAKNAYADKEKRIQQILRSAKRPDDNYKEFSKLHYWLDQRKPAPAKLPSDSVKTATKALNALTFRRLNDCELGQLQRLARVLSEKAKLAKTIWDYKNRVVEEQKKREG